MSDDHSPEPWCVLEGPDGQKHDIRDATTDTVVCAWWDSSGEKGGLCLKDADARRIVACVNYCAGIENEVLEKGRVFTKTRTPLPVIDATSASADRLSILEKENEALLLRLGVVDTMPVWLYDMRRADKAERELAALRKHVGQLPERETFDTAGAEELDAAVMNVDWHTSMAGHFASRGNQDYAKSHLAEAFRALGELVIAINNTTPKEEP